jgi:hypothetical protein
MKSTVKTIAIWVLLLVTSVVLYIIVRARP